MNKKWAKEYARLIGRIIFANFLEQSLEKYRNFIKAVETSLFFDKLQIEFTRLSRGKISQKAEGYSPRVIAEIIKSDKDFSIRYTYEGFNRVYTVSDNSRWISESSSLIYKLRRIRSRNELTHKIIKGIIERQKKFLSTGDPVDLVSFSQVDLAKWLNDNQSPTIDNSWISRLVNRLSVIIPSGEERVLKSFFPTQKDVNKRLIKKLLDKENEDLESGNVWDDLCVAPKKPYTDNQIRAILEREYGLSLSRWTVGHCRKDMGIPPAKRRLSGYKYPPLSANFSMLYPLTIESVQSNAPASPGIYEFRLKGKEIDYPNGKTQVIYIGSTKNIKKRLKEHSCKNSKNGHIKAFIEKYDCLFRYILFWEGMREEEKRLYGLFVATYSAAPKCNRVRP